MKGFHNQLKASTEISSQEIDLNISKTEVYCKHCLVMNDKLVLLDRKKRGKTIHLFCYNCLSWYCIDCLSKETIKKARNYPICQKCYRNRDKPEINENLVLCNYNNWCRQEAIYHGNFYQRSTDSFIEGKFCKRHYKRLYYWNIQRKARSSHKSFKLRFRRFNKKH